MNVTARGAAAHSSRPNEGASALSALLALARLVEERARRIPADARTGVVASSVTLLHAGTGASVVPASGWAIVDRRIGPSELPHRVMSELDGLIEECAPVPTSTCSIIRCFFALLYVSPCLSASLRRCTSNYLG